MKEDEHLLVGANYWREIKLSLKTELEKVDSTSLVIHNSAEFIDMVDFINYLPPGIIVYISLTKTYASMEPFVKKIKHAVKFVDCVSGGLFGTIQTTQVSYAKAPATLNEMVDLVKYYQDKFFGAHVIIDSLSQFMDFTSNYDREQLEKFVTELNKLPCNVILYYDSQVGTSRNSLPELYLEYIFRIDLMKDKVLWE